MLGDQRFVCRHDVTTRGYCRFAGILRRPFTPADQLNKDIGAGILRHIDRIIEPLEF